MYTTELYIRTMVYLLYEIGQDFLGIRYNKIMILHVLQLYSRSMVYHSIYLLMSLSLQLCIGICIVVAAVILLSILPAIAGNCAHFLRTLLAAIASELSTSIRSFFAGAALEREL